MELGYQQLAGQSLCKVFMMLGLTGKDKCHHVCNWRCREEHKVAMDEWGRSVWKRCWDAGRGQINNARVAWAPVWCWKTRNTQWPQAASLSMSPSADTKCIFYLIDTYSSDTRQWWPQLTMFWTISLQLCNAVDINNSPLHQITSCNSQLLPTISKFFKKMLLSTASNVQL